MFLILDDLKKIVHISKMAEKVKKNDIDYIKVNSNNAILDVGYEIVEVEEIPIEIIPEKYMYIDGEYSLNPGWVNPNANEEYEQRISALQEANATLEDAVNVQGEKISTLQDMVIMIANDEL